MKTVGLKNNLRVRIPPLPPELRNKVMTKLTINKVSATKGKVTTSTIRLVSEGGESAFSFTLNFDPKVLTFRSIALAKDFSDFTLTTTEREGKIGVLVDGVRALPTNTKNLDFLTIKFKVNVDESIQTSLISFGSSPTPKSTSNIQGALVPTTYIDGSVRTK